jgi:NAD(P)-dependent dehydrogenase (short-subunit alcohol dehydrogenase family)
MAEKTVVVVGGSRGIGRATAHAFAARGAHVMLAARDEIGLREAAREIGPGTVWCAARAEDPQDAEQCLGRAVEHFGCLDVLVNNAAVSPWFGRLLDAPADAVRVAFNVNVLGPLAWTRAAVRHGLGQSDGCVVNVASIGASYGGGRTGAYNLSKAALVHLTRHLAVELSPRVRVNAVSPGLVTTDFSRALWEHAGTDASWPWPLRRAGRPEDIAAATVYLASDEASWVTGHVLVVDGGASADGSYTALHAAPQSSAD